MRDSGTELHQLPQRVKRTEAGGTLERFNRRFIAVGEGVHIAAGKPGLGAVRIEDKSTVNEALAGGRFAGKVSKNPSDHPQDIRVVRRVGPHLPCEMQGIVRVGPLAAGLGVPPTETEERQRRCRSERRIDFHRLAQQTDGFAEAFGRELMK